jgi:hypothetical protein
MRLPRFFSLLIIATVISLIYVQLQVEIFREAYTGSLNESRLHELLDDNSVLRYNITQLTSAQHVGDKLLSQELNLEFAQAAQISEVRIPFQVAGNLNSQGKKEPNFFAKIFSLKAQAEAKQLE